MAYYAENPEERPEGERCITCDALLVERHFTRLWQTLMVCGNVNCPDCDPKLYAQYLADKAEKETEDEQ